MYTTTPPGTVTIREVAIQSVDVVNHSATGMGRQAASGVGIQNPLNQYFIDTSYYVGGVQIQPAVGEQWQIQKINGQWRLHSRISFNDPNQSIVPTQGQHIVGSGVGPVELSGTQVNANAPLGVQGIPIDDFPEANTVPPGTMLWDVTSEQPLWSNGVVWKDAGGNIHGKKRKINAFLQTQMLSPTRCGSQFFFDSKLLVIDRSIGLVGRGNTFAANLLILQGDSIPGQRILINASLDITASAASTMQQVHGIAAILSIKCGV